MKQKNLLHYTDVFIIGSFLIVIFSGLFFYFFTDDGQTSLPNVIGTAFLLVLYIFINKIYETRFPIVPPSFFFSTMIFAFFSVYLGSFLNFYERFPWWDILLHFSSGILLTLLCIILVASYTQWYIGPYKNTKDILFLVIIGMLVSISLAVFWEFYEYGYDLLFDGNMQRSFIVENVASYDFAQYVRPSGRFMDPGLQDTMFDMFLATSGAFLASIYAFTHFRIMLSVFPNDEETTNVSS